jgi:hypothetical protein
MNSYAESQEKVIMSGIGSVVTEFFLPLQVEIANKGTRKLLAELLCDCRLNRAVDCWRLVKRLNEKRPEELSLQTGLVIAFDGNQLGLQDDSAHKPEEPPEWGWTQEDGVILLRLVLGQPLRNLVRHEMGHLLGIGRHHSHCVMAWECASENFCDNCKGIIAQTCEVVD